MGRFGQQYLAHCKLLDHRSYSSNHYVWQQNADTIELFDFRIYLKNHSDLLTHMASRKSVPLSLSCPRTPSLMCSEGRGGRSNCPKGPRSTGILTCLVPDDTIPTVRREARPSSRPHGPPRGLTPRDVAPRVPQPCLLRCSPHLKVPHATCAPSHACRASGSTSCRPELSPFSFPRIPAEVGATSSDPKTQNIHGRLCV